MNELLPFLSAVPVVGGIIALLYSVKTLRESVLAQQRMVAALRSEIEEQAKITAKASEDPADVVDALTVSSLTENKTTQVEVLEVPKFSIRSEEDRVKSPAVNLGDNDPALVRHLYWQVVKGGAKNPDASRILMAALGDLAAADRRVIKSALKNNTDRGRVRYIHRLFTKATAE
ncbi:MULTISPECIES: hypothetical protein [unclassified Pseudomonas]|uniref:hypothetical protein n=1 Tax=unclassified Pseudomonas TaxID=196821 RepID=UPI002447DFDD|nr:MULTISPECIES: hypothetical protein [unclassified Pseudomonas]MDG9926157.1 hypothetical protein [Pseudomonas sp. GD04045]MDH0037501.1 hypothetical protein [Pseudomonas sp. GD04019]